MAAPAYGTSGTYFSASSAAPSFAVPASVAADDIIVIPFFTDSTITITALPAGFAHVEGSPVIIPGGGSHRQNVIWKRATGADAGTYDVTLSASTFVEGQAHRFTGAVTTGTPFDSPTATATDTAVGTVTPAVNITTAGADRRVLHCATCWAGGTWTPPTGYTKRQQGGAGLVTLADVVQAVAGATGNVTASVTGSDKRTAFLAAMIPAASLPSATPDSVNIPVTVGDATVSIPSIVPDSVSVPVTVGDATVSLGLSVTPDSVSIPVTIGSPAVGTLVVPDSVSIPVTVGDASAGPTVSTARGSWWTLLDIAQENREWAEQERARGPMACPNDGEPLRRDRHGKLRCPFDGWTYQG